MKHSTMDLLLAAQVRELALKIRHGEWERVMRGKLEEAVEALGDDASREQMDEARFGAHQEWLRAHPLNQYIPRAFELVVATADVIAEMKTVSAKEDSQSSDPQN